MLNTEFARRSVAARSKEPINNKLDTEKYNCGYNRIAVNYCEVETFGETFSIKLTIQNKWFWFFNTENTYYYDYEKLDEECKATIDCFLIEASNSNGNKSLYFSREMYSRIREQTLILYPFNVKRATVSNHIIVKLNEIYVNVAHEKVNKALKIAIAKYIAERDAEKARQDELSILILDSFIDENEVK